MSESGAAAQAANENATSRSFGSSRRSCYNSVRNQHLATIASIRSKFKGKIKTLAIIGKAHERTATYVKFIEEVKEYVSVELDQGDDLELLLETQSDDFDAAAETQLPILKSRDESDLENYRQDYQEYRQHEKRYKVNKRKLFGVSHGQCTPTLIASIKSQPGYTEKFKKKDVLWMLGVIKKLSIGIDDNGNDLLIAHDSLKQFYTLSEGKSEPNEDYMERFKESWKHRLFST